ncbi:MAG: phosphodiester glycosidase family protein, partial [Bacteroidota bacterium]
VGPQLVKSGQVVYMGSLQFEPLIVDPRKQFVYSQKSQKAEEEPRATRAFVGFRTDGTLILGVSVQPVRLSDLALFVATKMEFGGLGCSEAVNLCGGGSEVLAFRTVRETQSYGNRTLRQAALLTFVRAGQ